MILRQSRSYLTVLAGYRQSVRTDRASSTAEFGLKCRIDVPWPGLTSGGGHKHKHISEFWIVGQTKHVEWWKHLGLWGNCDRYFSLFSETIMFSPNVFLFWTKSLASCLIESTFDYCEHMQQIILRFLVLFCMFFSLPCGQNIRNAIWYAIIQTITQTKTSKLTRLV